MLSVVLMGCRDRAAKHGVLIDSAVKGVEWESEGVVGVTDAEGRFEYTGHNAVRFFIGKVELGEVPGDSIITPLDLAGADSIEDDVVTNIARLLQSLDDDMNPDNGIVITPAVREAAAALVMPINFDQSVTDFGGDSLVSDLVNVAKANQSTMEIVTAEAARAHLSDSLKGVIDLDNNEPLADAGVDQTVSPEERVILKGKASNPTGQIVDFQWELIDADPTLDNDVVLLRPGLDEADEELTLLSVTFTAPLVTESTELSFRFTVENNNGLTASDTVSVTVEP
ncbi:MAG: hypothetical protein P8176_11705 [Gammaproteobacteria bacterium]